MSLKVIFTCLSFFTLDFFFCIDICVCSTDLDRRSRTSYTAPCNGVVSHGAPIGGFRVFADHTRGNKHKQNVSMIFAPRAAFYACLSSHSDRSTYAPDESRLFWSQEKLEYPQFEPHAGIKMVQVLASPVYICGMVTSKGCKCQQCKIQVYKPR